MTLKCGPSESEIGCIAPPRASRPHNTIFYPSVESTGDVMDNMGKDNLGGGNTNYLDSYSNFDTFNNHKVFSDTLSRMSLLI